MRKITIGLLFGLVLGCSVSIFADLNPSGNSTILGAGAAVIGHVIVDAGSAVIGHLIVDSGTITTVTTLTGITNALPVGANVIGKTSVDQATPGTTNAVVETPTTTTADALTAKAVTANTTQNVKASAGNVYALSFQNTNASVCWLQFYNTASTPTCGTAVIWSVVLPVSGTLNFAANQALQNHATGIGFCAGTTATGATACTTAINGTIFYK